MVDTEVECAKNQRQQHCATGQANYSHVDGINAVSFYMSIPLAIRNRNQAKIRCAQVGITQSQEQERVANNQGLANGRDAYEGLQASNRILQL